jgi:hypothetical protein
VHSRWFPRADSVLLRVILGLIVAHAPQWAAAQSRPADTFPIRQQPIDYFGDATRNPLAELDARLATGAVRLTYTEGSPLGYLPSLLTALEIPVESQVLTFSAAARNAQLVTEKQPRALYFNDDVYVGYVPGSPELELATFDADKGFVFFTLRQLASDSPRLDRDENCTQCHVHVRNTAGVPGLVLGTMLVEPPAKRSELVPLTLSQPWPERFGTWYLTGRFGGQRHRGNSLGLPPEAAPGVPEGSPAPTNQFTTGQLAARFDVTRYPSPHSDGVALLVLAHQVAVQNLATRLLYERAFRRETQATEERLARELLFADEQSLVGEWTGSSAFAQQYPAPRAEALAINLRELDLHTRLYRWPLSPQFDSRPLQALPAELRARLVRRLQLGLEGRDESVTLPHPEADRRAVRGLLGTVP